MDRCELATQYHKQGFNCSQSVLAAFEDLTKLTEQQALAVAGGFGGGMGGTHQEICGTMSGAVMALSLIYPHTTPNNNDAKKKIYKATNEFRKRFESRFGKTNCGDLLKTHIDPEACPAAVRLGIHAHCDVLIVAAVEIVEEMLEEANVGDNA